MSRGLALAALLAMSGCAIFTGAAERAGELVAKACGEDQQARELALAAINQHAAPHAIELRCANDPK